MDVIDFFFVWSVGFVITFISMCIHYVNSNDPDDITFIFPFALIWPIGLFRILIGILGEEFYNKLKRMRQARVDRVKADELKKKQDEKENVITY